MEEIKKNHSGDGILAIVIIALLLVVDQTIKVLVKTHMCLGDSIHITDWFQILFIENNGMAYGMTLFNKLVLSLFRIVAIATIGYYLCVYSCNFTIIKATSIKPKCTIILNNDLFTIQIKIIPNLIYSIRVINHVLY